MGQLRIHNLTEAEEVTGNEKLVIDESSLSNALSLTLNKLATYILSKTESVMHAETLYYNLIADGGWAVGEVVTISGTDKLIGISLDSVTIGEPLRVAYAGKCQVLVNETVNVIAGDFAVFDTSTREIKVGDGSEIANRIGTFLETSSGEESARLVWVLLKL